MTFLFLQIFLLKMLNRTWKCLDLRMTYDDFDVFASEFSSELDLLYRVCTSLAEIYQWMLFWIFVNKSGVHVAIILTEIIDFFYSLCFNRRCQYQLILNILVKGHKELKVLYTSLNYIVRTAGCFITLCELDHLYNVYGIRITL